MSNSFLVNEIYPCLQGEGPNLGKPSLLVRFQICNLRCSWCDTTYTHTIRSDSTRTDYRMRLQDLVNKIQSFPQKHLILTGGEPTLQNLGLLMRSLPSEYTAEVESNGTRIPHKQIPGFFESDYARMQWNISPKFSNANETLVEDSIRHWGLLSQSQKNVFFKFVIRPGFYQTDVENVLHMSQTYKIKNDRIFLMPEGVSIDSQIKNKWLAEICMKYGFYYTPRLHVLLFGNERGT